MDSKSGGHDPRIRGRGGHGKSFDASRPNLSSEEKFLQTSVGAGSGAGAEEKAKLCNISFKPTSNGGRGGQAGLPGACLFKQTLEKSLTRNLEKDKERGKDGGSARKQLEKS